MAERLSYVLLLFQPLPNVLEGGETLVGDRRLARAFLARAVGAALRTEAEARFLAQRLHRDGQLDLFESEIVERDRSLRVELDVQLFFVGDLDLLAFAGDLRTRAKSYVKGGSVGKRERLGAARAVQVGGEGGRAVGDVLPFTVPLLDGRLDLDAPGGGDFLPVQLSRRKIVGATVGLRPVLVDDVEFDDVAH